MYDQEKLNDKTETSYHLQQDDEYGLPEAEFSPLEQDHYAEPEPSIKSKREIDLQPQQKTSSWPIWVGLVVLLAVAGFSVYYFIFNDKPSQQLTSPPVAVQQPEPEPEIVEEAPVEEAWAPEVAAPKEGTVTAISATTGRYYVIVGSFIDGDMAGDYAKKLAAQGKEVTLIEPTGNKKFYRLGIADAGSFSEANAELDDLKNTFGQEIWILRY